uniref:Uncharacterized protein n=1 Tax=viral metagenome TaxID=1070528 RepID=A0A6H1ZFT8_9ZZZZ
MAKTKKVIKKVEKIEEPKVEEPKEEPKEEPTPEEPKSGKSVVVEYKGDGGITTREYSLEVHGAGYKDLAKMFAGKKNGKIL